MHRSKPFSSNHKKLMKTDRLSARQCILPVLLFLIIQLSVTLVIGFFCGEGWLPQEEMSSISTGLSAVLGLAAVCICDRRMGIGALGKGSCIKSVPSMRLPLILFMTLALAVAVNFLFNGLVLMTGIQTIDPLYQKAAGLFAEGSFAFQIITYGILVPLSEEALFRGVIYAFFKSRFCGSTRRHITAILFTSLVFSVYHGNFTQGIYTFLLSIIFCLLADRGGLILSVVLHMGVNLVSLIGQRSAAYTAILQNPSDHWTILLGAAVASVILYYFICKLTEDNSL